MASRGQILLPPTAREAGYGQSVHDETHATSVVFPAGSAPGSGAVEVARPVAKAHAYNAPIRGLNEDTGALQIGVTDANPGASWTAADLTTPAHGSLVVNSDGSFSYVPAGGYLGPDSFTYSLTDSYGYVSASATVSLTVVGWCVGWCVGWLVGYRQNSGHLHERRPEDHHFPRYWSGFPTLLPLLRISYGDQARSLSGECFGVGAIRAPRETGRRAS